MAHSLQLGACHFYARGPYGHFNSGIIYPKNGFLSPMSEMAHDEISHAPSSIEYIDSNILLEVPPGLLGKRINLPVRS